MNKKEKLQKGDIVELKAVNGYAPLNLGRLGYSDEKVELDCLYEVCREGDDIVFVKGASPVKWREFPVHKMHVELYKRREERPAYEIVESKEDIGIYSYNKQTGSMMQLAAIRRDTPILELEKVIQILKGNKNQ